MSSLSSIDQQTTHSSASAVDFHNTLNSEGYNSFNPYGSVVINPENPAYIFGKWVLRPAIDNGFYYSHQLINRVRSGLSYLDARVTQLFATSSAVSAEAVKPGENKAAVLSMRADALQEATNQTERLHTKLKQTQIQVERDQQNHMPSFYQSSSCSTGLVLGSVGTLVTNNPAFLVFATLNCISAVEAHIETEAASEIFQGIKSTVFEFEKVSRQIEELESSLMRFEQESEKKFPRRYLIERLKNVIEITFRDLMWFTAPSSYELLGRRGENSDTISDTIKETIIGLAEILPLRSLQPHTALPEKTKVSAGRYQSFLKNIANLLVGNNELICEKNESGFLRINIKIELISDANSGIAKIKKLRLHFWPKQECQQVEAQPETIHSHPIYFESYVINGGYTHELFAIGDVNDALYTRHVLIEDDVGKKYNFTDKPYRLKTVNIETVKPGNIVAFPHALIHRVLGATQEETLTLNAVIESEADRQQFSVFVSEGNGPGAVKTTRENLGEEECKSVIKRIRVIISSSFPSSNREEL